MYTHLCIILPKYTSFSFCSITMTRLLRKVLQKSGESTKGVKTIVSVCKIKWFDCTLYSITHTRRKAMSCTIDVIPLTNRAIFLSFLPSPNHGASTVMQLDEDLASCSLCILPLLRNASDSWKGI